ncbi:hypothetical protein G7046_g824 [Stylonectria norvegica]|nr:hypothetical protein G7046_g824 [Stylonectria norvegica]
MPKAKRRSNAKISKRPSKTSTKSAASQSTRKSDRIAAQGLAIETTHDALNCHSTLLSLPLEVRNSIYSELIEWANIKLWIHTEAAMLCPRTSPYQDGFRGFCVCAGHIPSRKMGQEIASLSRWILDYDIMFHRVRKRDRKAKGLWSLLNLMASCRQIRDELGCIFWRKSYFHIAYNYGHYSGEPKHPERLISQCLTQKFLNFSIAQNIRKLVFRFEDGVGPLRPQDPVFKGFFKRTFASVKRTVETVFSNLPNLVYLKLFISGEAENFRRLKDQGILDTTLALLKKLPSLSAINIQGPMDETVLTKWQQKLNVSVVAVDGDPEIDFVPVCKRVLGSYDGGSHRAGPFYVRGGDSSSTTQELPHYNTFLLH